MGLLHVRPVPKSKLLGIVVAELLFAGWMPFLFSYQQHQSSALKVDSVSDWGHPTTFLPPCCQDRSGTLGWLCGLSCPPVFTGASCDNNVFELKQLKSH